jgi:hypothetical protein
MSTLKRPRSLVFIQGSQGQEETQVWVSSEHLLYFYFNIEIWLKNVYRWRFGETTIFGFGSQRVNSGTA